MAMISYSQSGQDLFVHAMTEGKTNGFYLDIGCNHPTFHSNTYALEQLGWTGLLVDIVDGCESRKGTFVKCDAANPDERLLFQYDQMPPVIDFLSLDVDEALERVLVKIPFAKHTFRVICLEHDVYCRGFHAWQFSRRWLKSLNYELVCGDVKVIPPGLNSWQPFEDWWCSPDVVNPELIKQYRCDGKPWNEIIKCAASL
jgi:hypothetical protein